MTTPTTSTAAATGSTSTNVTSRYTSPWSTSATVITAPDLSAPPQPSTPTTARSNGNTGRFLWNGLGRYGESMPTDLAAVELHLGTAASYTPTSPTDRLAVGYLLTSDTYRGDVVAGQPYSVPGLSPDITYYATFVARDKTGNRSLPSLTVTV